MPCSPRLATTSASSCAGWRGFCVEPPGEIARDVVGPVVIYSDHGLGMGSGAATLTSGQHRAPALMKSSRIRMSAGIVGPAHSVTQLPADPGLVTPKYANSSRSAPLINLLSATTGVVVANSCRCGFHATRRLFSRNVIVMSARRKSPSPVGRSPTNEIWSALPSKAMANGGAPELMGVVGFLGMSVRSVLSRRNVVSSSAVPFICWLCIFHRSTPVRTPWLRPTIKRPSTVNETNIYRRVKPLSRSRSVIVLRLLSCLRCYRPYSPCGEQNRSVLSPSSPSYYHLDVKQRDECSVSGCGRLFG